MRLSGTGVPGGGSSIPLQEHVVLLASSGLLREARNVRERGFRFRGAATVIRERRCEEAGQSEPRAGASGAFQNTLLRSILLCVVRACLIGRGSCWPLSCIQYAACHLVHQGRRQNGGHETKRDMDCCTEAGHTLQVSVRRVVEEAWS